MRTFLHRTGRYMQVGLICAVLNNVIVMVLDRAGLHYALCVVAAFVATTAAGYVLHAAYTFRVSVTGRGWVRFASANLSGFPLSLGTMALLCDGLGFSASVAMPIATVVLFAWNYLVAHRLMARPSPI